jgi:protein O-mannosyl-transferase
MKNPVTINPDHSVLIKYCIIIFIMSFLISANTLSNKFAFDDKSLIEENRFITEGTTLKEIFTTNYRIGAGNEKDGLYRPLVMLSYVLNSQSSDPMPFHFVNVIINALNGVLLFLLIYVLTANHFAAFLTSLLFSFHPIHTEAVANISGRPELMCAFFILISYLLLENIFQWKKSKRLFSEISAAFFLFLAILSKETAVMLPFIVITVDFALKRSIISKPLIRKYGFLFSAVLGYIIIRWLVLGDTMTGNNPLFVNNPIADSPAAERMGTALAVLLRYAGLLLVPLNLSSDYSFNSIHIYRSILHIIPLISLLLLSIAAITSIYARKISPVFLIAFAFFFFPYIIVSNLIFPIGTIMGERLMYLPSIGFVLLLGAFLAFLYKRWKYTGILIIIILSGYSARTYSRNTDWHDDYTLTKIDYANNPKSVKLIYNMSYHAVTRKQYDAAESYMLESLEIYPEFSKSLSALGKLFYDRKQLDKSIHYYERSKQFSPDDPEVIFDYVAVLIKMKRFAEAESELKRSLKTLPDLQLLYRSMGSLKYAEGDFLSAVANFDKSLQLGGDKRINISNITAAYFLSGDYINAGKYARIAESAGIRLNPELLKSINAAVRSQ